MKKNNGFYEFIDGLFAIGEEKVSTLCVAFFITLGFTIYKFVSTGSIDNNMKDIIITFILSLVGTNGINKVTNTAMQVKNIKDNISNNDSYSMYNNEYDNNYNTSNTSNIDMNEDINSNQLNQQNNLNNNLPKGY